MVLSVLGVRISRQGVLTGVTLLWLRVMFKLRSLHRKRVFFLEVVTGGNVYFPCGFIQLLEVGVAHLIPLSSCTACLSQTSPCP